MRDTTFSIIAESRIHIMATLLTSLLLSLTISACRESGSIGVPTVISGRSCTLSPGESIPLAVAGGVPGDATFGWNASVGNVIPPTGPTVIYTAPNDPGEVIITVTAEKDGKSSIGSIICMVVAMPTPSPTITNTPISTDTPVPTDTPTPSLIPSPAVVSINFGLFSCKDQDKGPEGWCWDNPDSNALLNGLFSSDGKSVWVGIRSPDAEVTMNGESLSLFNTDDDDIWDVVYDDDTPWDIVISVDGSEERYYVTFEPLATSTPSPAVVSINFGLFSCKDQDKGEEGWCWDNPDSVALLNGLYSLDGKSVWVGVRSPDAKVTMNGESLSLFNTDDDDVWDGVYDGDTPWDIVIGADGNEEQYYVVFVPTPSPTPLPLECWHRALTAYVFPQLQDIPDQRAFYGPTDDEDLFRCDGVRDIVHSEPVAVRIEYRVDPDTSKYGYFGIGTLGGYDAIQFSQICLWVYAQQPDQVFRLKFRDTLETEVGVTLIVREANEWSQICRGLDEFSNQGVDLSQLYNINLGFEEANGSSTIWVDDFELR